MTAGSEDPRQIDAPTRPIKPVPGALVPAQLDDVLLELPAERLRRAWKSAQAAQPQQPQRQRLQRQLSQQWYPR